MTQDEFNEAIKDGSVLVDYWAEWCPSCSAVAPIVEDLAKEYGLKVVKVDVDSSPEVAESAGIRSIPTLHLYESGQKSYEVIGSQTKERMVRKLRL